MCGLVIAEMQLLVASVYNKYETKRSPRTTDADMELDYQFTVSGLMVLQASNCSNLSPETVGLNLKASYRDKMIEILVVRDRS
jgi:hypothetical protein